MASKNKTEHLGLNLWQGTDRPQRGDFNSDNMLVDGALGGHIANDTLHLTSAEKERVKRPVQFFSYLGNGSTEASVSLGFTPSVVVVYCEGMPMSVYDSEAACTKVYAAVAGYGAGSSAGVSIVGSTVKVVQDTSAQSGIMKCLNESSKQYKIAAVR